MTFIYVAQRHKVSSVIPMSLYYCRCDCLWVGKLGKCCLISQTRL